MCLGGGVKLTEISIPGESLASFLSLSYPLLYMLVLVGVSNVSAAGTDFLSWNPLGATQITHGNKIVKWPQ